MTKVQVTWSCSTFVLYRAGRGSCGDKVGTAISLHDNARHLASSCLRLAPINGEFVLHYNNNDHGWMREQLHSYCQRNLCVSTQACPEHNTCTREMVNASTLLLYVYKQASLIHSMEVK
jgi:hypothetical protein